MVTIMVKVFFYINKSGCFCRGYFTGLFFSFRCLCCMSRYSNKRVFRKISPFIFHFVCLCPSCSHLPALNVGLQLFQSLQFLHLPLGLIDVGADRLHGLQGLFHCWIISMLFRGPLQQFLWCWKRRSAELQKIRCVQRQAHYNTQVILRYKVVCDI